MWARRPFSAEIITLICVLCTVKIADGNREHKVHNIVLYPDKHSWCTTKQISQVISYPGCKQVVIDNNVCVGACFSYSIPQTEPSDPGEVIGPYCDSCQPSETVWHHVTLDCREQTNHIDDENYQPTLVKRVQIITNCSCNSCEKKDQNQRDHHQNYMDSVEHNDIVTLSTTSQSLIQNDIPELLEVVHLTNDNDSEPIQSSNYGQQQNFNHYDHNNPSHTSENVKKLLHHKITTLVKNIQEKNLQQDKNQLIDVLKLIRSTNDENMNELIESLKAQNGHVDIEKLKEELDISEHHHKIKDNEITNNHHHHHHQNKIDEDHNNLLNHQYNHHQHNHNHVNGESIDRNHHLQRGPHGALVIKTEEDSNIEEKIVVNPLELKPNHAGTIVSYGGHHNDHHQHHQHNHHSSSSDENAEH